VKRTLYDTDHLEFGSSAQEFINSVIAPRHDTIIEQKLIDRDIWIEAGKLGFLSLGIPARFGGGEANDFRFNSILTEKLSGVSAALPSAFGIHTDIVAPYLVELTSEAQKQHWLPKFCSGEVVTAIAMSEPAAGSDLAGIRTVAKRDGSNWIINGSKIFHHQRHQRRSDHLCGEDQPEERRQRHYLVCPGSARRGVHPGAQARQSRAAGVRHR
jgi:alkylation response protein AidB-like acyl-CoA dehydrogenase